MAREDVNMGGARGEDNEDGERGHQDEERKGERGEEFSRVKPAIATTATVATDVSRSSACSGVEWTGGQTADRIGAAASGSAMPRFLFFRTLQRHFSPKTSVNNTHNETQVGLAALSDYQHNRIFSGVPD